jgi:tellurite resistance protein
MSDDKNPLQPLEKAHEESWFMRRNAQLIEQMRDRMQAEEAAALLKQNTGVDDDEIALALARLGVTADTAPALHLVPLVQVAWADGEIHGDERDLLLEAADATGVTEGPAREFFESLLEKRPADAFFDTALDFIGAMLQALPESEADKARNNLTDFAHRVAKASGGLFGLFWTVDDEERDALAHIAEKLEKGRPKATEKLLDKV